MTQSKNPNFNSLIILIPGLNGSGLELGGLPRLLELNEYQVLIPELDGYLFGSPALDFHHWLIQMHLLIDSMMEKYNVIHIGGLSMGATLALAVASTRSDLGSVILMSPVLKYDGWSVPWYRPILDIFYFFGVRNWKYAEREPYGIKNISLRKRISEKFKSSDISEVGSSSITAKHLHEAKNLMRFTLQHLKYVRNQILIIQSVEDDTCTVWSAQEILRKVKSDSKRAIWLGNSYHIVTIDNERELVLNEVLYFLNRAIIAQVASENNDVTIKPKKLRSRDNS